MHTNTTPVPNILFDVYLKELQSAELKVLLVIIRKTLGWADRQAVLGRKEVDWISGGQLQALTGSSRRAITSAIEALIQRGMIEVSDGRGNALLKPAQRKGKLRLYYRLLSSMNNSPVENMGKTSLYPMLSESTCANFAQDLRKEVTGLAQKMRITK